MILLGLLMLASLLSLDPAIRKLKILGEPSETAEDNT